MKAVCVQCRIRKVRCNGQYPACNNCSRLHFECSFQLVAGQSVVVPHALDPPRKYRGSRACLACRTQKTRCLGEMPVCSACQRRNRTCIYHGTRSAKPHIRDTGHSPGPLSDDFPCASRRPLQSNGQNHTELPSISLPLEPSEDRVAMLIAHFFERLFPLPSYAFLHQATVVKRCKEQTLDESLKLAICAITVLQIGGASSASDAWAAASQQLILQSLARPSVLHLQSLLLIIRYRAGAGDFSSAFLLAGLAARSAIGLRLNYDRSDLRPVAQEVRRRTFWSLYLLDDIFSVGLRDFELCHPEIIQLQLPCEDVDFERERPVVTSCLLSNGDGDTWNLGARALFVRVTSIRRVIMTLNRKVYLGGADPSLLLVSIRQFEERLQLVRAQLDTLKISLMVDDSHSQWHPQSVMLRMSWHQCYCDLYRIFLTGYAEAAPRAAVESIGPHDRALMRGKCLEHAHSISQILIDFAENRKPNQLLDFDAAVCVYHSVRLMLFGSCKKIYGSAAGPEIYQSRAKACLEIMNQFFSFLNSVKPMLKDLERLLMGSTAALLSTSHEQVPVQDNPLSEVAVAKDASIRQRLSIHSLLLQADFIDDSFKVAESPAESRLATASHRAALPNQEIIMSSVNYAPVYPAVVSKTFCQHPDSFTKTYDLGSSLIFNAWMGFPGRDELAEHLNIFHDDF